MASSHCTTTRLISALAVALLSCTLPVFSAISTTAPLPPLQWLNITRLLSGPSAPPLKGASLGYDDTTRSLLIFGGESESGFPQSNTYILNLDSLIWTTPVPPTGLDGAPPARSNAIGGSDMAASDRHGHVVIGGKGANGEALSDIWEYDYINQFWTHVNLSPGGPSARWGSSGGVDPRIPFTPVGLNNSFYVAGGTDGTTSFPLSDLWRLNVTGTLSSNLAMDVYASWESMSVHGTLPSQLEQAGAIINEQVVAVGGCNTTGVLNNSCAQGNSFVINAANGNSISPAPCTVPRVNAVVAPNLNGFSTSFASQMFVMLGTYNQTLWQDGDGLEHGEVAVLDIGTGAWSRGIPAGDPDSLSPYPPPRNGAAAVSWSQALIGTSRTNSADTIVFGGQDTDGKYLSEMWLLRAYNGVVSNSNGRWEGYGNGQLTSGANADGSGVAVTFLTECAKPIPVAEPGVSSASPSSTSSTSPTPTQSSGSSSITQTYDTQFTHKLLAPLSVALLLPAVLLYRVSSTSVTTTVTAHGSGLMYASAVTAVVGYGLGVGGLATSFTSITSASPSITKRSMSPIYLKTAHGKAGIALFAVMYGLIPVVALSLFLARFYKYRSTHVKGECVDTANEEEKEKRGRSPAPSAPISHSAPDTPVRSHSRTALWPGFWTRDDTKSTDESVPDSIGSSPVPGAFEVTNRPKRVRRASNNTFDVYGDNTGSYRSNTSPRNLGDISWLERRRSLNAVGELDYALSQLGRGPVRATSNTAEALPTLASISEPNILQPKFPGFLDGTLHMIFQVVLLALCVFTLVELWNRAPVAAFAVFLVWTVAFYLVLFVLAWKGKPAQSVIAVAFTRIRNKPSYHDRASTNIPSRPLSLARPESVVMAEPRSPYLHHQPPFRATPTPGPEDDFALISPRLLDTEEDDDDEDEDVQQRRMEDEMSRRDVSIVTVPRRKLWITNPSYA